LAIAVTESTEKTWQCTTEKQEKCSQNNNACWPFLLMAMGDQARLLGLLIKIGVLKDQTNKN